MNKKLNEANFDQLYIFETLHFFGNFFVEYTHNTDRLTSISTEDTFEFLLNPIPAGGGVNLTPPVVFFT